MTTSRSRVVVPINQKLRNDHGQRKDTGTICRKNKPSTSFMNKPDHHRSDAWIKQLGQNRGSPRIYLDGLQAVRAGFSPGDKYDIVIDGDKLVLAANKDGSRVVSKKKRERLSTQ